MKRSNTALIAYSASLAFALAAGCSSQTAPTPSSSQGGPRAGDMPSLEASSSDAQAIVAEATFRLEKTFDEQFVRGRIDRVALAGPIQDVLEAVPIGARERVQQRIDRIVGAGEKLASEMTPKERAELAAPPSRDKIGHTEQLVVRAWGWPTFSGWGGLGAFGFPGMFLGWGGESGGTVAASSTGTGGVTGSQTGFSTGSTTGSTTGSSTGSTTGFQTASSTGSSSGCGLGYGCYGWFW